MLSPLPILSHLGYTEKKKQELPYFEGPDSKGGPQQTQQTAPVSPIGALRADIQVQTLTGIPFTKTEVSDALLRGQISEQHSSDPKGNTGLAELGLLGMG